MQLISKMDSQDEPTASDSIGNVDQTVTNRKKMYTTVPISRVNSIMRSCPNLTTVKNDAIALTTQAAELFIQDLVKNTYNSSQDKSNLTYNTLANFIAQSDYMFLKEAIPERITVGQYYELRRQMDEENDS